jgi:hypothetical protein
MCAESGVENRGIWYTIKNVILYSGYHSNEPETKPTAISLFEDLPPCRMHLGGKGSEASFSVDQIDFGEVNRGTPARRCLLLYNHSTHMNLIFAFQRTGLIWYNTFVL